MLAYDAKEDFEICVQLGREEAEDLEFQVFLELL